MTWRAKATKLASDQGLFDLQDSLVNLSNAILMSILFGCLGLSTASSVLYLSDVSHVAAKWPIALFSFTIGLVISLIYFLYFHKRQKFVKAVRNLSLSFQNDVQALVHAPGDLKTLQLQQKTLIIVDAVNVLKNILVRTYLVGNTC